MSNDNSLEVNVAISQKNLSCMIFQKKNDRKQNERKSMTVCSSRTTIGPELKEHKDLPKNWHFMML